MAFRTSSRRSGSGPRRWSASSTRAAAARDEVQGAIAELEAQIAQEVGLVRGGGERFWILVPILLVGGVVLGAFLGGSGSGDAETIFGDVQRATGSSPVPVGARCTVFVSPVNDDDARWDTDVEVLCGGRLLYGGETLGGVDCRKVAGRAVRCDDTGYTDQGGDPRMRFDRPSGKVVVADRRPDYRVEIVFAPPPMRLE
jgi:hypothetical protein